MKYKNIEDGYEGIRKRVDLMLEGKRGIPAGIKKIITEVVVRRCEEFSLSAPELNRDLMSLEQSLDTVEFGKMLKGYENAAGLCMGGEKKILLGQGYLGNLRRNENEYGSNWNAFETLTHELGHVYVHPNFNTFKIHEIDPVWVKHLELEADTFASEYLLDDDIFEKYIDLSFEQLASELGISTHLVMLKFNNLSNDKKKELEEIYINNYSLFNSI